MSYQVIARKWRPQTFEEVTGQEAITRTLHNAIEHDRLHHAYIFSGSRGVGKTTTARLLAKSLNCHKSEKPTPTPCNAAVENACDSCREISESRSIDVLEFDAASHTGVEDVREIIIESININPARDRFKVFIIDEVHMLSNSSFNALLKTLEEPPPRVAFVMATTELHKLPDTILSRCQEFEFRSIPLKNILERLKTIAKAENIKITDEALREIARSGEGSMRDAQSNFDQVISFSGEEIDTGDVVRGLGMASIGMLTGTIDAVAKKNPGQILEIVDDLIGRGQDMRNFCRDLLSFFRDLLVVKMAGDVENLLDTAILSGAELQKFAELFTEADLIRFFQSLSETELKIHEALQPRYVLEIGLVKLIEMQRVAPVEQLLERISKLERALENADFQSSEKTAASTTAATETAAEKKTLASNLPPPDTPFPASNPPEPKKSPENTASSASETDEPKNFEEPPDFIRDRPRETSDFIENLKNDFLESIPVSLSTITDEELEHFEDKWLDAAYEQKLLLSGDDLKTIKTSSKIVEKFSGPKASARISGETANGTTGAAVARAKDKPIFVPPTFDEDISPRDLYELPENPGADDLRKYAESHPLVRKALRIFRGEIIRVKQVGGDTGEA